MSVTFQAIGRSDVGRVRTNNEDNAAISTIEREPEPNQNQNRNRNPEPQNLTPEPPNPGTPEP